MLFMQFIFVALIVIIISIAVSSKAEWFEENTKIKGIIVGIALAASTSLPELVTGITSVYIDQPEMAVSSILGSNHFNFIIISMAMLTFIKYKPNTYVGKKTNQINIFFLIIYGVLLADLFYSDLTGVHFNFIFPRVSLVTIIIIVLYFVAIKYFNSGDDEKNFMENAETSVIIKQLAVTLALVIMLVYMSIQLAKMADLIVKETGMPASSVGAVLVGASTSLPELVSAFNLVKNKKYDIAFSATLGSNLFNFLVLGILDIIYKDNIMTVFTNNTTVLIYFGIANAIIFNFLVKRNSKSIFVMATPFILSILSYVLYLNMFFI